MFAIIDDCDCKFRYSSGYHTGALSKNRIKKMAFYRNQYLKHINKYCKLYDYMMCFDFDLEGGLYIDGFLKNFDPDVEKNGMVYAHLDIWEFHYFKDIQHYMIL